MGNYAEQAQGSLTAIAVSAGISENRMKGSFTQIAAFAKTTGMDTADALALSERAMVAVADSAAFYDRTLEETTASLQSFLKGNFENDAALGLSCTETTRNAAANELYGKSFIELSESQKQLTLLKMVEDANAASGALGQASRESDTWTNQLGNLKQAATDFSAMIGANFLPVAISVVTTLQEMVTWLTENERTVKTVAAVVGVLTVAIAAHVAMLKIQAIGIACCNVEDPGNWHCRRIHSSRSASNYDGYFYNGAWASYHSNQHCDSGNFCIWCGDGVCHFTYYTGHSGHRRFDCHYRPVCKTLGRNQRKGR